MGDPCMGNNRKHAGLRECQMIFEKIWGYIRPKTRRELEEEYLAKSVDMVDLERRIKLLENPRKNLIMGGW
jgi:hypothetical protein